MSCYPSAAVASGSRLGPTHRTPPPGWVATLRYLSMLSGRSQRARGAQTGVDPRMDLWAPDSGFAAGYVPPWWPQSGVTCRPSILLGPPSPAPPASRNRVCRVAKPSTDVTRLPLGRDRLACTSHPPPPRYSWFPLPTCPLLTASGDVCANAAPNCRTPTSYVILTHSYGLTPRFRACPDTPASGLQEWTTTRSFGGPGAGTPEESGSS